MKLKNIDFKIVLTFPPFNNNLTLIEQFRLGLNAIKKKKCEKNCPKPKSFDYFRSLSNLSNRVWKTKFGLHNLKTKLQQWTGWREERLLRINPSGQIHSQKTQESHFCSSSQAFLQLPNPKTTSYTNFSLTHIINKPH